MDFLSSTRARYRAWLMCALLAPACEQSGLRAGDPCSARTDAICAGSAGADACIDRVWTPVACSQVCEFGITQCASACSCDEPCEPGCSPDSGLYSICDGSETSKTLACSDVCQDATGSPSALPCEVDAAVPPCLCSAEGTGCDQVGTRCETSTLISFCQDAVWQIESCPMLCGDSAARCIDGEGGSECSCE